MPLAGTGLTALQGCWSPHLEALWSSPAIPRDRARGQLSRQGPHREPLDLAQGANSRSQAWPMWEAGAPVTGSVWALSGLILSISSVPKMQREVLQNPFSSVRRSEVVFSGRWWPRVLWATPCQPQSPKDIKTMFVRLAEGHMATRGQSQRELDGVAPHPPRPLSLPVAWVPSSAGPPGIWENLPPRASPSPGSSRHRGVLSGLPGLHPPGDDPQKCAQTSLGAARGRPHGGPMV